MITENNRELIVYKADQSTKLLLPYFEKGLVAGFPSPAASYKAKNIDLNVALSIDADNTRLIKVFNDDLGDADIFEGDLVVLDQSVFPSDNGKILCSCHNEIMLRILKKDHENKRFELITTNHRIPFIPITSESEFVYKGLVTYSITPHLEKDFFLNYKTDESIDLNKILIRHPLSTFLGLIEGDSMKDARILDGDLAIVDRSLPYIDGYIALCRIGEKFTVKYLRWDNGELYLCPANENYPSIKLTEEDNNAEVWGVVTYTVTSHISRFNKKL